MAKKSVKGAGQKGIQNIANVSNLLGTPKVDIPALPNVPQQELKTVKSVQGIIEETEFDNTQLPSTKVLKNIETVEDIHKQRKKAEDEIRKGRQTRAKEEMSAEEKHRRRVEAGKKAWKTRTQDWTPQDFRRYANQFRQHVTHTYEERTMPTVSNLEIVYEKITFMERQVKGDTRDFGVESKKSVLLSIMDDVVNEEYEYHDYPYDYDDYLLYHMEEIAWYISVIEYDSDAEEIQASFVKLAKLLNTEALTVLQAHMLSDISEFVQVDFDWDDI